MHRKALPLSRQALRVLLLLWGLLAGTASAQGSATLEGTVVDAQSLRPLVDVVVSATSPSLQGEQVSVTDASGRYRLSGLPPGTYTLRFDGAGHPPQVREQVVLRLEQTVRFNVMLLPEGLETTLEIVGQPPTLDVGSHTSGISVTHESLQLLPVVVPVGRGGAARSFESLADLAPDAWADTYGTSVAGSTSPENLYVVDGLPVNSPALGVLGTLLNVELISEARILTSGFLPEYGRSTGGVVSVVTKSGSNEFHGSLFGTLSPGALTASARGVSQPLGTLVGRTELRYLADVGVELGGPILKDRLWFQVALVPSLVRYDVEREFRARELDASGQPVLDEEGNIVTVPLEGTEQQWMARQRAVQYLAKLTGRLSEDHSATLSILGTPATSGGEREMSLNTAGVPELGVAGRLETQASRRERGALDIVIGESSAFFARRLLVDVSLGWHTESSYRRAGDGSRAGDTTGMVTIPRVELQRTRSLPELEPTLNLEACGPAGSPEALARCPLRNYSLGGPGDLREMDLERLSARGVSTLLFEARGRHLLKAGVDAEWLRMESQRAVGGGRTLRESADGSYFEDARFGTLAGPDTPFFQQVQQAFSRSRAVGLFVQDAWSPLEGLTLEAGGRHDIQVLSSEGRKALVLGSQWSPRLGVVADPTRKGRSRLFASLSRYYEGVPLDMADRAFAGEATLRSRISASQCQPLQADGCPDDAPRLVQRPVRDANRRWLGLGTGQAYVDPLVQPQSVLEVSAGAEYELWPRTRLGVTYVHRELERVLEDMSRNDGVSYFIGNPGFGFATDFPEGERRYDAVTALVSRDFSEGWLAQLSYTYSKLRGNYEGLFLSDSGQLDPNITAAFDVESLLINSEGVLPGDRRHRLKALAARSFQWGPVGMDVGLVYRGSSGPPFSYLGAHPVLGNGYTFILPRGSAGRLPWTHRVDARLAARWKVGSGVAASVGVDIFNLFNFQKPTAYDQNYTSTAVEPIPGGSVDDLAELKNVNGAPLPPEAINPRFGQPTAHQPPRSVRLGFRLSF
jgi:hypothetical protein